MGNFQYQYTTSSCYSVIKTVTTVETRTVKLSELRHVNLFSYTLAGFELSYAAVKCSKRIMKSLRHLENSWRPNYGLYIENIGPDILHCVVAWMEHHKFHHITDYVIPVPCATSRSPIKKMVKVKFDEWDLAFFGSMDYNTLKAVILAAYDMGISGLIEMSRKALVYSLLPINSPLKGNLCIPSYLENIDDMAVLKMFFLGSPLHYKQGPPVKNRVSRNNGISKSS